MVTVHLPATLVRLYNLPWRTVQVQAATVGELIDALDALQPGLRDRLCEADGSLREHLNLFVGKINARTDRGAALPLRAGDEVWIIPAVSGG